MSGEWATQIGTLVGATVGIGATVIAERLRWGRDKNDQWLQVRRELYARFLAGLAEAHGAIRAAASYATRPEGLDTASAVQEAFRACGIFELRQQLALIAPKSVARAADEAFYAIGGIRSTLRKGLSIESDEYVQTLAIYRVKLLALRDSMRIDLGVEPLHEGLPEDA